MHKPSEQDLLNWALKADQPAIQFAQLWFYITQIWDDLIDLDKPTTAEEVNRMMVHALVTIPMNPFYQRHQAFLVPLLSQYISDWMDANTLEKGNDHAKMIAYTLRDQASTMVTQCAFLIGGLDWSRVVAPAVREFVHDDSFQGYIAALQSSEG